MKCDKQCSYRTPYGYCSVTQCQTNLGTTYAEPSHFKKDVSEEYVWRINDDGTDAKIQKIIRCKDCKYWSPPEEYKGRLYLGVCARDEQAYLEECAIQMDADDFCSWGERK